MMPEPAPELDKIGKAFSVWATAASFVRVGLTVAMSRGAHTGEGARRRLHRRVRPRLPLGASFWPPVREPANYSNRAKVAPIRAHRIKAAKPGWLGPMSKCQVLAIHGPTRISIESRVVCQPNLRSAVGMHLVDFAVAIALADEGNPAAVRRPLRVGIFAAFPPATGIERQSALLCPVRVHHINLGPIFALHPSTSLATAQPWPS
jgi:hypothetical protein